MKVHERHYRTLWIKEDDPKVIQIIDQRVLPHRWLVLDLKSSLDVELAISEMALRGAPLIGVAAAFGIYLGLLEAPRNGLTDEYLMACAARLRNTRPTAVNLAWAIDRQLKAVDTGKTHEEKIHLAFTTAQIILEEDLAVCWRMGQHGLELIKALSRAKEGETVHILTHCNAGWLACVDWGTATSAIYQAHDQGIRVHVWVDETRPRNQGASLTAWELAQHGLPHTVIADNTGGYLMQRGRVDLVMVGADRATRTGDVANKIGTYLKALAAKDNHIPFYVALPSSSIDWSMSDGLREIPVEERSQDEVKYVHGLCDGEIKRVLLTPKDSPAANYGFDVTPARLITGLITERGLCPPSEDGLLKLFPEKKLLRQ